MYEAKITVHLKGGVSDPEGANTLKALHLLGYSNVRDAKIIRTYNIEVDGKNKKSVEKDVKQMCERLLINPVVHDYEIVISKQS